MPEHFFRETGLKPWILTQYTVRSWVRREGWRTKWSYVNELHACQLFSSNKLARKLDIFKEINFRQNTANWTQLTYTNDLTQAQDLAGVFFFFLTRRMRARQYKVQQFCRSQWCHRLEFWHLIGQLRLFHVTPRSERLPLEWMMKQTKSEFVVKLQVKMTYFLKMLSRVISYNCVSRKFHYIRSKTIEIRQFFQHSIDTPWKVSLQ